MKIFAKFNRHFMLVMIVACPLVLGGAKFWQDPAALSDEQNCANGLCCAKCIDTGNAMSVEHLAGWEWKMKVASRFMR